MTLLVGDLSNDDYVAYFEDNEVFLADPLCDNESLEVNLMEMDGHLYLYFDPVDSNSDCEAYLFDSRQRGTDAETVGVFRHVNASLEATLTDEDQMHIGTVSMANLRNAIGINDDIEPGAYNIINNNCAEKILYVLSDLGIEITPAIRDFCLNTLKSEAKVITLIRANSDITDLYPNETFAQIQEKSDDVLLERLISYTIEKVNSSPSNNLPFLLMLFIAAISYVY